VTDRPAGRALGSEREKVAGRRSVRIILGMGCIQRIGGGSIRGIRLVQGRVQEGARDDVWVG
jgi:hypothetical protein